MNPQRAAHMDELTRAGYGPTSPGPMNQQDAGAPQNFQLPPDHVPGMKVPKGGSSCSSCKYLAPDGDDCTNQYFIQWNGSPDLPAPSDSYCSDWY